MNSKQQFFSVRNFSFLVCICFLITNLNSSAQCASNATSTADEDIFNVTFGTLNNNSTCSTTGGTGSIQNEYSNYAVAGFAGSVPNIDRGCTIPFSVQVGTCGGNFNNAIAIYIDWNNDADFIDAGENVYLSAATTNGPHTETGNITVPVTATLGNCKMRVICNETAPGNISPCGTYSWGETEDYFVNVTNGGGVAPYVSSSVTQLVNGGVSQCALFQQIICIPVVMGAGCTAGSLTQFQLGAGSSTNLPADVSKIHIFYTGTSNVYTASNEFVAGGTTPSGANNTINGSQTLVPNATNYFWVTYDINNASTIGNLIDGSCTQITVGGSNQVPSTNNPAGSGTIAACPCSFSLGNDLTLCTPFTYTLNGPAGFDTYTWTPGGATTQNLVVNSAGTYTCTGTLINGGLVVNGNFSSGNTGFTTDYVLGTGGTWGPLSNAGTYSITNNPNAAHSNFLTFGDHTTGTGNMMVVNGADFANTIVWSQTITVTPNTTYNFSAWFASVANDISTSVAQLQFSINGNLIGPVSNAPLTGGVWANFFVNWNSGSSTSAVITIVDQRITGNNDFALDDITFERVCTFSDAITINSGSTATVSVPTSTTVCNNTPIAASSFTSSTASVTYTWSNTNTSIGLGASGTGNTPTFTAVNSGSSAITSVITVTPSVGSCIGTPNSYTITVNPTPTIAVNSATTCSGVPTLLTASGASTYTWSTGATTSTINPAPTVNTVYTVTGTTSGGCLGTATSTVTINSSLTVVVNSPTICSGTSTVLTASGATNYTWSTGATTSTISVSPTSTTNYTVTGNSSGCVGTNTSVVTVNTTPTVSVNNPTICAGTSTVLTASGATNYTWSTGATTPTISVSPTSTTNYTLTGNSLGCIGTNTSIVTVNSSPTITVNSPTICSGTSTVLTASGATNYTWSTGATTSTISVSPTSTTNYTVTGNSSSCVGTNTSIVTVNTTPTVSVNNPTICAGTSTVLTASGATNYTWSTGATTPTISVSPTSTTNYTIIGNSLGCTSTNTGIVTVNAIPTVTVNNPTTCSGVSTLLTASGATSYSWNTGATTSTISVTPTITTIYTVTGTSNGCSGTSTSTVTVNAALSLSVNSSTICAGTTTVLTANGATSYTWNTGATTATISVSPASTTIYSVTGETSGCTGNTTATVTVNAIPIVTANNATICSGTSTVLTAGGATTYTWDTGATTPNISVSPTSLTVYTVTGTTNGCSGSTTATVTVNALPVVTLTPASSTLCAGQNTILNASGATTYTWLPSGSGTTSTVTPASTTVYTVTGSTGSCISAPQTATVTVNNIPVITLSSTPSTICAGQTAVISSTTSIPGGSYTWLPNNQTSSSITESPTSSTNYSVTYSVNGCTTSATSSITVNATPTVSVDPVSICAGHMATLSASTSIAGGSFVWAPNGATTSSINESPNTTTTYSVLYSLNGCTATATSSIIVNANPILNLTASTETISPLDEVTITATGGNAYIWNTGQTGSSISANPSQTTTYCATVTTIAGCASEACINIFVEDASTLYIPNSFTPNGDGLNDVFYTPGHNIKKYDLKIFNRWGQLLFSTTDPEKGWDGDFGGKIVQGGVYVYIIKAEGTDNVIYNKSGHITVLQ